MEPVGLGRLGLAVVASDKGGQGAAGPATRRKICKALPSFFHLLKSPLHKPALRWPYSINQGKPFVTKGKLRPFCVVWFGLEDIESPTMNLP